MKPFAPLAAAGTAAVALAAVPGAVAAVPQVACPAPSNDRAAQAEAYAIAYLQQTSPLPVSCTGLTTADLPTLQSALQQAIAISHQVHPATTRATATSSTRHVRAAARRHRHRPAHHR